MMFSLLLLSCALIAKAHGDPCPPDWTLFHDKCYAFGETTVTWGDAEEMCRIAGGILAEVKTSDVNTFLKNEVRQRNGGDYWLGANDVFHEGVWRWIHSGDLLSFTDWYTGQPNDGVGQEDCLALRNAYDYHWNDAPCTYLYNFICQREVMEDTIVG